MRRLIKFFLEEQGITGFDLVQTHQYLIYKRKRFTDLNHIRANKKRYKLNKIVIDSPIKKKD